MWTYGLAVLAGTAALLASMPAGGGEPTWAGGIALSCGLLAGLHGVAARLGRHP